MISDPSSLSWGIPVTVIGLWITLLALACFIRLLKLIGFHQTCILSCFAGLFHQSLYFLLAVSHFCLTKSNNIGGAAIKVSFFLRLGITECMEMDIITKSYLQGNIILLFWLTLMIGFFLAAR